MIGEPCQMIQNIKATGKITTIYIDGQDNEVQ